MLLFCPFCNNTLMLKSYTGYNKLVCVTCPYVHYTNKKYSTKYHARLKEVDDVIGGAEAWQNVDSTDAECPVCSHKRAYFMQFQTRSADEPMTTFYKCTNQICGKNWRD